MKQKTIYPPARIEPCEISQSYTRSYTTFTCIVVKNLLSLLCSHSADGLPPGAAATGQRGTKEERHGDTETKIDEHQCC